MILGLDPGLATLGWAQLTPLGRVEVIGLETTKAAENTKGRVSEDQARRAVELGEKLSILLDEAELVVAEGMLFHGPWATALCLGWGVIAGACAVRRIPLVQVSPKTWQRAVMPGDWKKMDYDALTARVSRYVFSNGSDHARSAITQATNAELSHMLDAVGIGVYGTVHLKGSTTGRIE